MPPRKGTRASEHEELAEGLDPRVEEEGLPPDATDKEARQVIEGAIEGLTENPIFGFETDSDPVTKTPLFGRDITAEQISQLYTNLEAAKSALQHATPATLSSAEQAYAQAKQLYDGAVAAGLPALPPVIGGASRVIAPDVPDKDAGPVPPAAPVNPGSIRLARPEQGQTADLLLWTLLRNRTNAISFNNYFNFVNNVLCEQWADESGKAPTASGTAATATPFKFLTGPLRNLGANGFNVLKDATELFLMHEAGIIVNQRVGERHAAALQQMYDPFISLEAETVRRNFDPLPKDWVNQLRKSYYDSLAKNIPILPYFTLILDRLQDLGEKGTDEILTNCYGVLPGEVTGPLAIELIWSYWHEEGMLAQTFNAISNRFQNRRLNNGGPDPLARLEIDPLRRLNHYIWGWIQQEPFRLSVRRRAFEYDHEYGLPLLGKAVGRLRGADTRSKFLESLHNLLYTSVTFHLQDDDLTVQADGFPVLNALRETQLVLTEGSHNQYGDLPWVARVEMMMQQWMLGRPEMRDFLGGRVMVPYIEPWMDRVDTVKTMLEWTPTNVTHFRDLGVFGEQILLSVRYGTWAKEIRPEAAANWCRYWRPEIQGYVHAYRAVTGADLRQGVEATMPGVLLQRRLSSGAKALHR
jgi:hypothetical protein